jgi:TatA/E family protein of Tat protein translocase
MFGSIGLPELLLIFVIALLLFGPRKLPDIGKSLGKAMGEFRRASNDLQRSLEEEVAADELRAARREVEDATKPVPPTEPSTPAAGTPPQPTEPK